MNKSHTTNLKLNSADILCFFIPVLKSIAQVFHADIWDHTL